MFFKMCSCTAPTFFLQNLEEYSLPQLPEEICHIIIQMTTAYYHCRKCNKVIAKSINSHCKIHCGASLMCADCKR